MKALLQRFKNSGKSDRFLNNSPSDPNITVASTREKEKLDLPPLRQWPPQPAQETSPKSFNSLKPLPPVDETPVQLSHSNSQTSTESRASSSRTPLPPDQLVRTTSRAPSHDARNGAEALGGARSDFTRHDSIDNTSPSPSRAHRKTAEANTASDNQKKVAFLSPAPTPVPLTRVLSEPKSESGRSTYNATAADSGNGSAGNSRSNANGGNQNGHANESSAIKSGNTPLKTTVSRFQATHGDRSASSSRVNVSKSGNGNSVKGTTTASRTPASPNSQKPFGDNTSLTPSMRSNTPYSQASAASSRILATASWSEAAEDDLVSNLGPRERTRQEVLWEIVASEDR